MNKAGPLTAQRVHELVMANRAIRAPSYDQDHDEGVRFADPDRGLQWGADAIPALLGLFRVEKDPREDHPNGWVGFARHRRGDTLRLDFDLKSGDEETAMVLVVTAVSGRVGERAIVDVDFGEIELPEEVPTEGEWDERGKRYRAARGADDADGKASVLAYTDALSRWKREVATRFDAIVEREVPHVRRAVKWHIPFYGIEGQGWFASFAEFSKHVKLSFVCEEYLEPRPPTGTGPERQAINIKEKDPLDEEQIASWIRQAAAKPALGGV